MSFRPKSVYHGKVMKVLGLPDITDVKLPQQMLS
jgi:hypothetical protein